MSRKTRIREEAPGMVPRSRSAAAQRAQSTDRDRRRITLADDEAQVREVLALTEGLPRDPTGVILGPDGVPLFRPVVKDFTRTYAESEVDDVRLYAEDILKRAARMQRDGASLEHIATELDIRGIVPLHVLEAALRRVGHPLLNADIAAGVEPAESKIVVAYEAIDDDEPEDPTPRMTGAIPLRRRV